MAQKERLEYEVTANTKGFVQGMDRVSKANKGVTSSGGQASNVILNITRGANDAKFGFAGLANNLEFVIESFGQMAKKSGGVGNAFKALGGALLGPIGIVAGISLLIGYGPQIIKFFQDWWSGAEETTDSLEDLAKTINVLTSDQKLLAKLEDDYNEKLQEKIDKTEEFTRLAAQGKSGTVGGKNLLEDIAALDALLLKLDQGIATVQERLAAADFKKRLKPLLDIGKSADTIKLEKFQSDIAAVTLLFDEGIITFDDYIQRLENLSTAFEKGSETAAEAGLKMGDALKAGIAKSLSGLGDVIGNALSGQEDFGDKFLGIIGAFMKTFGAAIIAIGVAALELEVGLSTGQAWLAIGGGVALVAAGAVLSNLAGKGIDGKGSTSASTGGGTPSTGVTPLSSLAGLGGGQQQLVATVRGQDLRFILQGANDTYRARN